MAPYGHAPPGYRRTAPPIATVPVARPRKQTDAKAVISLFLGLASFVFGPATGIPAIIVGSIARRDIDRSSGRSTGRFVAGAGTLAGFFGVGFSVVFVLWIGSALVAPPGDTAQTNARAKEKVETAQAHAKVVKTAPSSSHPRGDVEAFHSIR